MIPSPVIPAKAGIEVGQFVLACKTPRGIELRAVDAEFEAQMGAVREVMARRSCSLRELGK